MDYVQKSAGNAQFVPIDKQPYLARIADAAMGLEGAVELVQDFISRCRGGESAKFSATAPDPNDYFGQIERLGKAVAAMDKLARELGTIG